MGKALMVAAFSANLPNGNECNVFGWGGTSATEANLQIGATDNCTFEGLAANFVTGAGGTNTFQFRKNAANVNQVVSRSGPGAAEDTTHSDILTVADLFNLAYTDTGTDTASGWVKMNVTFASGHGCYHGAQSSPQTMDVTASTRYHSLGGTIVADGTPTEADTGWKVRGYDSFDAFQAVVSANARVNDSVFKNRINGADGTAILTFGAGVTGLLQDTAVGDAITAGHIIDASLTLLAGVEDLDVTIIACTLKSSTSKSEVWAAQRSGLARAASATAHYFPIGGNINALTTFTEAQARIKPGFAATVSNLRCYLSANTYGADATLKLYQNGTAVLTTTLTASGGAAWYENAVNTVDIDTDDELSYEIVDGTSGSATINAIGITFTPIAGGGGSSAHTNAEGSIAMRPIVKGSTDQSVVVRIVDATDGTPELSVLYNTTGIDMWYRREGEASVDITEATLAALTTAHADGGFLHINDGYYRLDLPDAAVATGTPNGVMVGGAVTGMVVIGCYVPLWDFNPNDVIRGGLTALPNALVNATGGLSARILRAGTAAAVGSSTVTLDSGASAVDDYYNGCVIWIPSATTGSLQGRVISDYVGSTKVATVSPSWATTPTGTVGFIIEPQGIIGATDYASTADMVAMNSAIGNVQTDTTAVLTKLPIRISKNTAYANFMFKMVLSSDHVTPATGKTVTCQRSIDGAGFANWATATATEISDGWYKNNLAAADLNGDAIALKFTATGCDQVDFLIVPQTT